MSIRDAYLPVVDTYRGFLRTVWDLRRYDLIIRTRAWASKIGVSTGPNDPVDSDLLITPPPRFDQVSENEISGSGGRYQTGDIRADLITPAFPVNAPTAGYTPAQLVPTPASKFVEILYVVSGPNAGEYSLVSFDQTSDANFTYTLILRRRRSTP